MNRTASSPFTDPDLVRGRLYATPGRLARRTGALHRARVTGRHAGQVIADLAHAVAIADRPVIADIGCGRGTTTGLLREAIPSAAVVAVDLSAAMLTCARDRKHSSAALAQADFHHLPFRSGACDVVVAAFCLYHSPRPHRVIEEIGRCLRPDGFAIIAVKSADSYRELDQIVALSRLDPDAMSRPSLYEAAHAGNIGGIVSSHLAIRTMINDQHRFVFPTLTDAASYLATSPKYELPDEVAGNPDGIAAALRRRLRDGPVCTTSVVTYVVAGLTR